VAEQRAKIPIVIGGSGNSLAERGEAVRWTGAAPGIHVHRAEFSTGVDGRDANGLSVWPDPADDHVRLRAEATIVNVRCMGIDGREVIRSSHGANEVHIDLGRLAPGAYTLEARLASGAAHRTTLIEHRDSLGATALAPPRATYG
jgi:hypothetical protein